MSGREAVPLVGTLAGLPAHVQECVVAYGDARVAQLEAFCEALVSPSEGALNAFQEAFVRQLKKRKWFKPGWHESAEVAGVKALIAHTARPFLRAEAKTKEPTP